MNGELHSARQEKQIRTEDDCLIWLEKIARFRSTDKNSIDRKREVRHTTLGLALFWLDVVTSAVVRYWASVPAGRFSIWLLFIFSTFSYKFSFSSGQTVGQFPNCTKPRPLCAIQIENFGRKNV